jgi:hypothetical protein
LNEKIFFIMPPNEADKSEEEQSAANEQKGAGGKENKGAAKDGNTVHSLMGSHRQDSTQAGYNRATILLQEFLAIKAMHG